MLSTVGRTPTSLPNSGGILTQNRAISRRHVKAWGQKVAWDAPPCQRPPPPSSPSPLFPLCPAQDGEQPPPFGQISPWQALPFSLLLSKDT